MTVRYPRLALALLLVGGLLAGCSHDDAPVAGVSPAYAAMARGRIDVEGGLLRLAMPAEGVVASVAAHEGEHVRKGQLLARLDSKPALLDVEAAQAQRQQAAARIDLLQAQLRVAQTRARRLREAAQAGAGDTQSADDAQASALQLRGELDEARAAVALAAQKLAAARYALTQRSLLSPLDGTVVQRLIQPGTSAGPSSGAAFVLLPDGPRIVRAELNESFADAVHVGMSAQIVDDSGSGMPTLHAHVLRIGQVFGINTLEDDPQARANSRAVQCVLAIDPPVPGELRIGQRVLVRFGANGDGAHAPR